MMTEIAKALEETIIADVAAYYAGQPQRNPNPVTLAEPPPAIIQLVELGDPRRNIPPCAACHRAGAGGPIETPVLAEQRAEYIVRQLKLYASGERHNDVYARRRRAHVSRLRALSRARARSQHDWPEPCRSLESESRIVAGLLALLARPQVVRHRLE
jgi:cytochrome c553